MTNTHQTRRRLLQMAGAAATSSVAAGVVSADEHTHFQAFTAELTGNAEPHAVETDATGITHFEVDQELEKIDYILEVDRLDNGTQAHIHLGEPGEEGPIIAWLYSQEGEQPALCKRHFTDILADGTLTVDDLVGPFADEEFDRVADTLAAEGAYVNVHTEAYPAGEIRGQILPEEPQ